MGEMEAATDLIMEFICRIVGHNIIPLPETGGGLCVRCERTFQGNGVKEKPKPKDTGLHVGGIKRPSAEELFERNNPVIKETNDAMRDSMKEMPQ